MSGSAVAKAVDDAVEIITGDVDAPVFLTCEHASERLPEGFSWPEGDTRLRGTHWAYDLGARAITLELAAALRASAVLARFTRLLADPNREEQHADLFRTHADGEPVFLNAALSEDEKERRIVGYHRPFHAAVDAALGRVRAPTLLSIHSFTPNYQGEQRTVEIGVLFHHDEPEARALGAALTPVFPRVAYNEPWSGLVGLIYSAERHATAHGRIALELEVRQDLAEDAAFRARLVRELAAYFSSSRGMSSAKLQGR